ncbi:MAG: glycosyltransferase family 4 protein [Pseudomonadota bacterium]
MKRKPRVLRPFGYPARFNTPRDPQEVNMITRRWLPLHKAWMPLEVALVTPTLDADLIATFNRIPLGPRPFVITFESHLPRLFNRENSAAFRFFSKRLAGPRCRAIIPISDFARRQFMKQHEDGPLAEALSAKLTDPIPPSIPVAKVKPRENRGQENNLRCVFVGGHFIRKGGLAVLHAAREAHRRGDPIEFHIVSDLTMGARAGVWTDPSDLGFAADLLEALSLPNVAHHGKLPNSDLLALLTTSDVSMLPTLSDTYGYSVIESFAMGLPAIGTACCALPEIIAPGRTGELLELPVNSVGVWAELWSHNHESEAYRRVLLDTVTDVGDQLLVKLRALATDRDRLEAMSDAAFAEAKSRFASAVRDPQLEDLYLRALKAPLERPKEASAKVL